MIQVRFAGSAALITGGTQGIGKAIAMEFARAGAAVFVTYRWESVSQEQLASEFAAAGLPKPTVLESDVSDPQAVRHVMRVIGEHATELKIVISNVAFAKPARQLADLKKSSLELSLAYSGWPVVEIIKASAEVLGRYPKYVVGISSNGIEVCHDGYALVGASKAVLETLCRYLALMLKKDGVRVNIVRPGFVDTSSARALFGAATLKAIHERAGNMLLDPRSIGETCVALCSGLMDAVTGHVLVVDEGWSLVSPLAYLTGAGVPEAFPESSGDS